MLGSKASTWHPNLIYILEKILFGLSVVADGSTLEVDAGGFLGVRGQSSLHKFQTSQEYTIVRPYLKYR